MEDAEEEAFHEMKQRLLSYPVLRVHYFSKGMILHTDRKEKIAQCIWWRALALSQFQNSLRPSPRHVFWLERLYVYHLKVFLIPGRQKVAADALSRNHLDGPVKEWMPSNFADRFGGRNGEAKECNHNVVWRTRVCSHRIEIPRRLVGKLLERPKDKEAVLHEK